MLIKFIVIAAVLLSLCLNSQSTQSPLTVNASDLRQLRWIEGSWRGTGDVEKPFFERYRFENDSTLVVESYDDESFSKVSDVTKFELKDGHFGNSGDGSQWVVTSLDDRSVVFSPIAKARNTFRWQKESDDVWIATLNWPANGNTPARQRVYRMVRVKL